ncbi:hypothetical protein ACFW04_013233 [Cataglyphis niger]
MAQSPPRVIVLAYPLPERLYCPRCRGGASNVIGSVGSFSDQAHLIRHLKKHHPGDSVTYKCSACDYRGTGKVPLRTVINHYKKEHAEPPRDEPGRAATSGAQSTISASGGFVSARTRAPVASSSAAACTGASSRSRTSSRPPTSSAATSSTARTPPATTTPSTRSTATPGAAGGSPTYAAVTAAGPSTRTSSSTAPLSSTQAAAILDAVAMTAATRSVAHRGTAATSGKARHLIQDGGSLYREDGAANGKRPSPAAREARVSPRGGPHGGPTTSRGTSATPPTPTTGGGTMTTRSMRRSISAPLVKSGVTRPVRMPPRRSPNTISPSFGGLGGTGRRTPERTPPMTSQGGHNQEPSGSGVQRTGREVRHGDGTPGPDNGQGCAAGAPNDWEEGPRGPAGYNIPCRHRST